MARTTAPKSLYLIEAIARDGTVHATKIGIAVNPFSRLRELQNGNHLRLRMFKTWGPEACPQGAADMEENILRMLRNVRGAGEWLFLPGPDIAECVDGCLADEFDWAVWWRRSGVGIPKSQYSGSAA